jgi:alpha-tubulin suppressor-like RCC1 family protein
VETCGNPIWGGDSSSTKNELLYGVTKIAASGNGFAILKTNGNVIDWGCGLSLAPSETVRLHLQEDVIDIFGIDDGFAALKSNGDAMYWASVYASITSVIFQHDVKKVVQNTFAFAFLKNKGSVFTCGSRIFGGDSSCVSEELQSGVVDTVSLSSSFLALTSSGKAISWGSHGSGGNFSLKAGVDLQSGVTYIFASTWHFAALKSDNKALFCSRNEEQIRIETEVIKIELAYYNKHDSYFRVFKKDGAVIELRRS